MNFLPLNLILATPIYLQVAYFASSLVIGVAGTNKKMGFWGYLFSSILLSPIIGLMLLLVSDNKKQ